MPLVQSSGTLQQIHAPWFPSGGIQAAGSVALYENRFSDYASIWRTQPNVRTVVGFLARNVAQLGIHIFDRVSDEERRRVTDGLAGRWLRRPAGSRKVSRYDLINWFVHDLMVFDDAYWLKVAGDSGVVTIPLLPQQVEPFGGTFFEPDHYRIHGSRGVIEVDPDQVFHVHGYNPENRRTGLSPMETLRRIIAEDDAAGRYREQFWNRGARFESVIERPREAPEWSDGARVRFKTDWQARYSGAGPEAGATPILEDGMTLKEASHNAKDAEYIAARKLTRQEVASAFYVLPSMVGIMEHANFANMREQHRSTYQDTLGPIFTQLQEALQLQLAEELGLPETAYFEFNIHEKMRGSFEEEAASMQTAVGAPIMTRNEARARRNLPPIDGGNELITPLNVLVGGQASPTDSGSQNVASRTAKQRRDVKQDDADERDAEVDRHREMLARFFSRQESVVATRIGAVDVPTLEAVFDRARWDDELTADLFAAALATARLAGREAADQLDADLDGEVTDRDGVLEALEGSSRGMAEEINGYTADQLAGTVDGDDPLSGAREVFAAMAGARAAIYAASRVTTVWNFGRGVGASAAGATAKTWRTTSSNPRSEHAAIDGETVPIGDTFSNGARWPGDPSLPPEERANCACTFDVS